MDKPILVVAAAMLATGIGTAAADEHMMKGAGETSRHFQLMDQDGDGYVSREEARAHAEEEARIHRELEQEAWGEADADRDGRLDESEFSAWEKENGKAD